MRYEREYFEGRKQKLSSERDIVNKRNTVFSIIRLLIFFVFLVPSLVLFCMNKYRLIALLVCIFSCILFYTVFVFHGKVKKRLEILNVLLDINDEYIYRVDGDIRLLKDKGEEFIVQNHDYCGDLDIFGDLSVFALTNVSESAFGRKKYADDLLYGHVSKLTIEDIRARQNATSELANNCDFMQDYQACARIGKLDAMPYALLNLASQDNNKPMSRTLRILYKVSIFFWLIPLVLFVLKSPYVKLLCLGIILLNLAITYFCTGRFSKYFKAADGIARQTQALFELFEKLETAGFKDKLLNDLIFGVDHSHKPSYGLKVLSKACDYCKFRAQPLFSLILNIICLFDLRCADKMLSWSEKFGKELKDEVDSLSKIESLMSASTVEMTSRKSSVPSFVDSDGSDNAYFYAKEMCHPLIKPDVVVSNSITIDHKIALITGSNMSGKTTLLRTIGINSILAYTGARVYADELKLGRMRIMSSMRIIDSIEDGMSTFKAELVRIAGIVSASRLNEPMLFLIDEIFRGTNSADRTSGALTVLEILSKPQIIGLMTTHDYALCTETENKMTNISYYHFSETYHDDGITFDYVLGDGVSKISNARFLMKLVGIV